MHLLSPLIPNLKLKLNLNPTPTPTSLNHKRDL